MCPKKKKKKKTRLDDCLTIYTKLNSKFMKDLRITPEAIKVLKQNIDRKILDIVIDAQCRGNKSKLNKWKHIIKVLVAQSCSTLCDTMAAACQAPLSMGILQTRILEWVPFSTQGDIPAGIEQGSPALQGDSLPSEPQEKHIILKWAAFPSPGDLPDLGVKPTSPDSPAMKANSLPLSHQGSPVKAGSINHKLGGQNFFRTNSV